MATKHLLTALASAAALSTQPALAGPSQSGVTSPGGFVTACASDRSNSSLAFRPGADMMAAMSNFPLQTDCRGQYFAGTAGTAANANYTFATGQSQSAGSANMGWISLSGSTVAPSMSNSAVGMAGGGWSESMVIDLPGHTGQSAVWRFTVTASGTMRSAGFAGATMAMTAFKDRAELFDNVPGFDDGNSDPLGTDRQTVNWGVRYNNSRTVADSVTFAVPVTLGQSFTWGVYATAWGSVGNATTAGSSNAAIDFSDNGLQYGGSAGLYVGGVAMNGYTLNAASGVDWMQATPVPEPGAWALMAAGLLVMGSLAGRRLG